MSVSELRSTCTSEVSSSKKLDVCKSVNKVMTKYIVT